jgi:hypothetical protein
MMMIMVVKKKMMMMMMMIMVKKKNKKTEEWKTSNHSFSGVYSAAQSLYWQTRTRNHYEYVLIWIMDRINCWFVQLWVRSSHVPSCTICSTGNRPSGARQFYSRSCTEFPHCMQTEEDDTK